MYILISILGHITRVSTKILLKHALGSGKSCMIMIDSHSCPFFQVLTRHSKLLDLFRFFNMW